MVAQIAISLFLLVVAAGLFVRTLSNLNSIELGFNRERLLLVSMNASQAGTGTTPCCVLSRPQDRMRRSRVSAP